AYVSPLVYVPGDATATAAKVAANADLGRIGVLADLLQATVFVFLAMTLYLLLARVQRNVAMAMVILVAIATTIMCLDKVFQFAALRVTTDPSYASAFGVAGSNALVLLLLDIHNYGYLIAQIFFGLWLVPLGFLAYIFKMFLRLLGVVLIVVDISFFFNIFVVVVVCVGLFLRTYATCLVIVRVALLVLVVIGVGSSSVARAQARQLAAPTGPSAVGRIELALTDPARVDPFLSDGHARELAVWIWYPTGKSSAGAAAPYLPKAWADAANSVNGLAAVLFQDNNAVR